MILQTNDIPFNPKKADTMHIDINSCFATIEQQANPQLRGKPIGVAAYKNDAACILAASVEAKKWGIKTGTRVFEAKQIYPKIVILEPDPNKYRYVRDKMENILSQYTPNLEPKSIDEFVLHLDKTPTMKRGIIKNSLEIKKRIKSEIGEWITVSIGIGPNRFLAKVGAGITKPDGLDLIDSNNYQKVFKKLKLRDLNGINFKNEIRLNNVGIFTVPQLYNANQTLLRSAFKSVGAYQWYMRMRGWEIDVFTSKRQTFNHSYVLPHPQIGQEKVLPIMQKLAEKLGARIRKYGYDANGINLSIKYELKKDGQRIYKYWNAGTNEAKTITTSLDMYRRLLKSYRLSPYNDMPVRQISITCYYLKSKDQYQLSIFEDTQKSKAFTESLDKINKKWGPYKIKPAQMLNTDNAAPERISFGKTY